MIFWALFEWRWSRFERFEGVSDASSTVIIIFVSCQPDLAFSQRKIYINVINTHFFSFLEVDWLKYFLLVDKTRFFDKLQENFLFWTVSPVAVPVGGSWMTATLDGQSDTALALDSD